jgi:hypothetical protein
MELGLNNWHTPAASSHLLVTYHFRINQEFQYLAQQSAWKISKLINHGSHFKLPVTECESVLLEFSE